MEKFNQIKVNIEKIIEEFSGEVGVIVRVNDEDVFSKNEDKVFQSASLIKLFILEALLEKISQKSLSYSDRKSINFIDKAPGFGVLKVLDNELSVTIKDLATLMITLSDNTATNILIDILGIENIQNFINKRGYSGTKLQRKMYDFEGKKRGLDNFTNAKDTLKVLQNLYSDETALYILKNQLCNSKIPLYFFRKVDVAHKTGDSDNIEHDAGRIFFDNIFVDLIILAEGENKEAVLLNNRLGECIYENFKECH